MNKKLKRILILLITPITVNAQLIPDYELTQYSSKWINTWTKGGNRTQFFCTGFNDKDIQVLYGAEMSFRTNTKESSNSACNAWIEVTSSILSGNNITKAERRVNGDLVFVSARYLDASIIYEYVDSTKGEAAGWYSSENRNNGFFSEGSFVTPLKSKPISGVFTYKGVFTSQRRVHRTEKLLKVDFAKNEIFIRHTYRNKSNNEVLLESESPIKFDPKTGVFFADLQQTIYRPQLPPPHNMIRGRVGITGAIGGSAGKLISASIHDGFYNNVGFDYILGSINQR